MLIKICPICQTAFEVARLYHSSKYCKDNCRKIAQRRSNDRHHAKMAIKVNARCSECGKLLSWHSGKRKPHTKCSACYSKFIHGSNSPAWRGGRKTDKDGYIFIYHPEPHPRRIISSRNRHLPTYYVAEHILEWEKANNRQLPQGYTVHHLNGCPFDNRPINLVALLTPRHSSGMVNTALKNRIKELEHIIDQYDQPLYH